MAATIVKPLLANLINLLDSVDNTFAISRTEDIHTGKHNLDSVILSSIRKSLFQIHSRSDHMQLSKPFEADVLPLDDTRLELNLNENGATAEQSPSLRQSNHASQLGLDGVSIEVQILRDALLVPVQTINALLSMYIVESFDEPLLQLLTPTQCTQLIEAISLADVVSELDKQLQVLKTTAEYFERDHDIHVEHVQNIKRGLVDALELTRSFAVQRSLREQDQKSALVEFESRDFSEMDGFISTVNAGLQDQPDAAKQLLLEQERSIIVLKLFLEDKIDRFKERWSRPAFHDQAATAGHVNCIKDWPSATIPAAQLTTKFLSGMLAHLATSSSLQKSSPSHAPSLHAEHHAGDSSRNQPVTESVLSEGIDEHDDSQYAHEDTFTPETNHVIQPISPSSSNQLNGSSSAPETGVSIGPQVIALHRSSNKRRDSAISLLSSAGKPEQIETHDDDRSADGEKSESDEEDIQSETENGIISQAATEVTVIEWVAAEEKATEEIVTEEAATQEAATEQTTTEETVEEEAATQEAAIEETAAEEVTAEETATEETVAEETVAEETAKEDTAEQHAGEQDSDCVASQAKEEIVKVDSDLRLEEDAVDQNTNHLKNDPVEDLYSADDAITPPTTAPPLPPRRGTVSEHKLDSSNPSEPSSCRETITSYTSPLLSVHWPPRAWLQNIVSVLAPGPEIQCAPPVSPSFPSGDTVPPSHNPSSSEWYSGYNNWWSSNMARLGGQAHVDSESESTTTSTSKHSWGAGSRSTEADSIDV